jgi:hypothetical protein
MSQDSQLARSLARKAPARQLSRSLLISRYISLCGPKMSAVLRLKSRPAPCCEA